MLLSVFWLFFLAAGCDNSPTEPDGIENIVIESVTKHPSSNDMCALSVTIRNLTSRPQYPVLDYDGINPSGGKIAFAVVHGTLASDAVQTFEATIHPFVPGLHYRAISCAVENFTLNPLSEVFSAPPSDSDRGIDRLIIVSSENVQTPRVCRLRLTLDPVPDRQVDVLLNYEAFNNGGQKIASASFPVILGPGGMTLEHTWTAEEANSSLTSCADIASFQLNSSSFVF